MAKDNKKSNFHNLASRNFEYVPKDINEFAAAINKDPKLADRLYSDMLKLEQQGYIKNVPTPDRIREVFSSEVKTPTTTTETEVVAEEETPQQGTPARTFPTPDELNPNRNYDSKLGGTMPITERGAKSGKLQQVGTEWIPLPNTGGTGATSNQPRPTATETQIAPIDQQAGQVQGGRPLTGEYTNEAMMGLPEHLKQQQTPISGDVLANAPKQQFQWSGQAPTKPVVQPQTGMPQTPEQGMQPEAEGGTPFLPQEAYDRPLNYTGKLIGTIVRDLPVYTLAKPIQGLAQINRYVLGNIGVPQPNTIEEDWIYIAGKNLEESANYVFTQGMNQDIPMSHRTGVYAFTDEEAQKALAPQVATALAQVISLVGTGGGSATGRAATKVPQLTEMAVRNLSGGVRYITPVKHTIMNATANAIKSPGTTAFLQSVSQFGDDAAKAWDEANSVSKEKYVQDKVLYEGAKREEAEETYDILKGKTRDEIVQSTFPLAFLVGQMERIPLEAMFKWVPESTYSRIVNIMATGGVGLATETIQEGVQTGVENVGIDLLYDKTRNSLSGVADASKVGGMTGLLLGLVIGGLKKRRQRVIEKLQSGEITQEEAIKEADEINKTEEFVNAKVDEFEASTAMNIPVNKAMRESKDAQGFFDKNEASLTNPITTMPTQVETIMDKIDNGILISPESLHEAYQWTNNAVRQTLENQTLTPAEKGATLNILNGMLTDIDRANTEGQRFVEQVEEVSVQDRVPAVREGVKPLPQGQAPKGTATPSISQAKAIREENRRKQAGTTTLPSSGQTIITPAPTTTEVATEAVTETPTGTTAEAEVKLAELPTKTIDAEVVSETPVAVTEANPALVDVESTAKALEGVIGKDVKPETNENLIELRDRLKKAESERTNFLISGNKSISVDEKMKDEIASLKKQIDKEENRLAEIRKTNLQAMIDNGQLKTAIDNNIITAENARLEAIGNGVKVPEWLQSIVDDNKSKKETSTDSILNRTTDFLGDEKADFMIPKTDESVRDKDTIDYLKGHVKRAIDNGRYEKAIAQGRMTANDAKVIIESFGLKVPVEIEKLLTPTQDAVQIEKASSVPVQSGTTSSQEVAKGEPKAEPQSTADKGQAKATATQEEVGTTPAEVASSEIANISDKTSVRDLASMQEGEVSAGVFSELNKGDKITIRGNEYVVTTKTKGTKKTEFKNEKGEDRYYTKSTITLKKVNKDGSLGSPISGTLIEYSNRGSMFVGGNAWQNLSRDIEGDITVDLINENNKFHEPSQSFKLAQQYVDKINAEVEKQQATATAEGEVGSDSKKEGNDKKIAELEKEKLKLTSRALKEFPNSPKQLETRARIDEINAELKTLKSTPEKVTGKTTTTEVTLNTPNETTIKDIEKIENATEKGRELALSKPVNKWVKRAFDSFQDLSSRAKKAGIYDGTTLKIGGKEYTVDTPAKFKAFLAQSQANFDAINEAVKDIPSEQKTDTNPSPKTVEEKSKEVFNDAKSTFVFPIGLNPKFKFDSRLPENVVRFFKKYFRPRGLWTKGMFSAKRGMENQISAQVQKSEFLVRDLRNAVKEAYPKGVTQEQLQAMNDVLQGMPREIPANLYAPLTKMREHIDELSQMMISEGIIDEKLVPVFDANMGIYTTRTYAIHNDPKSWLNYIENEPEGQQIRNNAVNFLRQATEAKADRLDKFADENEKRAEKLFRRSELAEGDEALMLQAKADEVIARADKQRQLAEALRSKDFDAYVKAYLEAEGQPLDVVRKGNVGAKDLGILKKRKNIPDAIRALMGEEKDPLTNYTMSVAKMSALIANNQFLNEVKVQGVADGLFTNEPKGKNIEMIASASTDSMSPLNGLYTTKDIAEAFKEFDANTKSPWYIDAMLWLDAAIKVNKTVLSQGTHIRNFISNPIIELANGYIPTLKGKAIDSQMEQILNRRFGDKEKLREYIIKLTELGVLGQGGNYREILSVYEDLKGNKYDYQKLIEPKITGAAKKSWNIAQKVYKGGDEFWKVVAFENERAVLEKAYGDTKTSEELDQMAADIIRKTRVDYSMVPKAVKAINKIPFTGTFVTFPAEVLRIGANIPAVAYEEMNSGNKVLREHGIKRMAGYLTAMTLPYGVKELAKYLLGMDDEEEEARKKFLAPWAQNSTLIWIGKDRYIDTGFSDAFSILKKPIVAFSRGKSAAEGALNATKEFLGPAISEGLGYKVSKNVLDNTDEFGNPIYDENADIGTIYTQVSTYVLKQVEPGTVSQARRLYLGETGALSEKGQQYRTGDEVLNAVFGIKPVTINWDNAVSYKFRDAVESINNSNKIFLKESKELRKDDKEGRRKAAESTNLAVENAYNDLREYYTSALKIGMIPQKVDDIMKQSGVPKELAYAVKNNTGYKNYIIVLNDGTVIDRNTQRLLRGR